ncbi:CaiB/BaiF CoA-transferase family protein [Seohaeicola sp. SP36]|uniref:CaiB/BaiF CoA transferase family protein n=1 Tax=unclassified Seohaeicola TaxID=2641111 RepID=UPI00237B2350|nr:MULTISPECIES: CaiB/BaiF CoA-transferase family protein [unclassified Seohaeicola]MDD9706297.1 CaiB/BaiF CoA-transferase family protein [Seohaeicola sp. 4SK31]MDD9734756.1 CaiB/BaiF CoA-transferase family protein [Seohaeicola sp. SP36]
MAGPLDGLKLVEMAGLGPCPLAGQLMADLGATVVVIDRASAPADATDVNRRGKQSVALNLKSSDGLEAARRIIAQSDILIEGFRPGVMEKLGLGPAACHAINPGLIFGRMTGWGQDGPLAMTAGHDINYLSLSGALGAIGRADGPPVPPLNLAADYGGGSMFLIFGVLAALYERSRSGRGQVVDAAMVDGVPAMMGLIHQWLALGRWGQGREANLLDGGAPFYRCYATKDGRALSVGPLEPQFFAELVTLAGLPEAHRADQNDPATWPARRALYAQVFARKTRDEWMAIFEGTDACVAPVLDWDEVEHHPHNAARGTFLRVDGVMQAAPAPRFDRTPAAMPGVPGAPGQDTDTVLTGLGYDAATLEAMRRTGALT